VFHGRCYARRTKGPAADLSSTTTGRDPGRQPSVGSLVEPFRCWTGSRRSLGTRGGSRAGALC
jgi:hypothetical protein